jgi:PhoD related phosphatase
VTRFECPKDSVNDQTYIDFVFEDIPFLKRWIEMEWDHKWKNEFSEETLKQVAEYYFNAYTESWGRDEVKAANQNVPGTMQWDGHDIFGR